MVLMWGTLYARLSGYKVPGKLWNSKQSNGEPGKAAFCYQTFIGIGNDPFLQSVNVHEAHSLSECFNFLRTWRIEYNFRLIEE